MAPSSVREVWGAAEREGLQAEQEQGNEHAGPQAATAAPAHDIPLTMFYAAMTHGAGGSCTLPIMRLALFPLLLLAVLGASLPAAPETLTLAAATDRTIYLGANQPIYVEARIGVPAAPATEGAAVRNVALVLDRSGSMAGEPVQALRQSVVAALGGLDEDDIVSIVLFGSAVEALVPAQRRGEIGDLDALLARIEPAGGAALYDALNQGAAQLRRNSGTATVSHLVLVTDGPATKGPRERDDFLRLVEVFAREGLTLSTIGLGADFEEDLLAALARAGGGHFRFAAQPADLVGSLGAELGRLRTPVAQEVVLAIEFGHGVEEIETAGWEPATIERRTATYRFPAVFAGQDVSVLAGAQWRALGSTASFATVRLRWKEMATGVVHETSRQLTVYFDTNSWASKKSIDRAVMRAAAAAIVSEGMQKAIEQLDRGDARRAQKELQRARDAVRDINYDLDDAAIAERIRVIDAYLTELKTRGLNQLDRKVLRSGLFNQFDTPTEEASEK